MNYGPNLQGGGIQGMGPVDLSAFANIQTPDYGEAIMRGWMIRAYREGMARRAEEEQGQGLAHGNALRGSAPTQQGFSAPQWPNQLRPGPAANPLIPASTVEAYPSSFYAPEVFR